MSKPLLRLPAPMNQLWLGYDGLDIAYLEVVAVLMYQSALDARITSSYGRVPPGVQSVVVTSDGHYFPARWHIEHVRRRWALWRAQQGDVPPIVVE